jgi:serine protease
LRFLYSLIYILSFFTYYPLFSQHNDNVWETIGITKTFEKINSKKSITIAIVDDGFNLDNKYLKEHFAYNVNEIPDNHLDDDNNGKVDDYYGWDFSDNDSDVNPTAANSKRYNHGTKVAGIILNTIEQILTDTKSIRILPLKSSSDYVQSNYIKTGYEAILYAIEQKADIIVCCWSGYKIEKWQSDILDLAQNKGILVVGSAGNFVKDEEQFPGAYFSVLNVGAINKEKILYPVSNCGNFVDIVAPGDSIRTISNNSAAFTSFLSSTSASTAVVSGIVAAFWSAYPKIKHIEWDFYLKNTASYIDNLNPKFAGKLGAGLINVSNLKDLLNGHFTKTILNNSKSYINGNTAQKVKFQYEFPKIKIIPLSLCKGSNIISYWKNNTKNDTILRNLNPIYISADSILFNAKKKIKSEYYYEAITIDSSRLYCQDIIKVNGESGSVTDGSGVQNYTDNSSCKWELKVAEGKKIKISFSDFDLESKNDQLYIFSDFGTESPILAIFSGHEIPPEITTWTNKALIWFVTNGTISKAGWKLNYESVE